jgi:hypothetical protein
MKLYKMLYFFTIQRLFDFKTAIKKMLHQKVKVVSIIKVPKMASYYNTTI